MNNDSELRLNLTNPYGKRLQADLNIDIIFTVTVLKYHRNRNTFKEEYSGLDNLGMSGMLSIS